MRAVVRAKSCARARLALSLVLDGEAHEDEWRELASHLHRCGACTELATAMEFVTRELRTWSPRPIQAHDTQREGSVR